MDTSEKFKIARTGTKLVVGIGVGTIITQAVAMNTAPSHPLQKILIYAGKVGISFVVNDLVEERIDKKIDLVEEWWMENVEKNEETV